MTPSRRLLPPDLPERASLALEVHARPPEPLTAPGCASHVALLVEADAREAEFLHLQKLARQMHAEGPQPGAQHWSVRLGALRLKWERHGEFSTLTLLAEGRSETPFADTAAALLPAGWLATLPGQTVSACHAELLAEEPSHAQLQRDWFEGQPLIGATVGEGAGQAFADFRVHADGFARFVLVDRGMPPLQAGRMLQRLFEIEAYRMMALLAFPVARRMAPRILDIEKSLAGLTDAMADPGSDEPLLQQLTGLAAEVESGLAATQYRFGACRAYAELVRTRIAELHEQRIPGLQTIAEFMARRFTPAVATAATTAQRLQQLSERVAQASHLLSTRVGIAREQQNHALLASMDRRAKLQLRLQQTVEGLSVAAIVYYLAGLVAYLAKGGEALGLPLDVNRTVALAVPVLAVLALGAVRKARRHAREEKTA